MKAKEKRFIFVLLMILVIVLLVKIRHLKRTEQVSDTAIENYVIMLEDGTQLNNNANLKQLKTLGTLQLTNIQLTSKEEQSVLLADVKNTGSSATEMKLVNVIFSNKNGETLGTAEGIIAPLEVGETTQLNVNMMKDYAQAYDFQIIEKGE